VLLDTSAYAAFMRGHPETVRIVREVEEIHLSSVVLGEMLAGFMSGTRNARNRAELARFLESPRVNLIDVDEETAERYAVIFTSLKQAGTPVPTNDLWIAASAMQHGLRLLTLDTHFQKIPQILAEVLPP
jgi:predicted nucleic acid-binding protein